MSIYTLAQDLAASIRELAVNRQRTVTAAQGFGKKSLIIFGLVWGCATLMVSLTIMSYSEIARLDRDIGAGVAGMPKLPKVALQPIPRAEIEAYVRRFNGFEGSLKLEVQGDNALLVSGASPADFQQWLLVVGLIEAGEPEWKWKLRRLCIGSVCQGGSMQAVMIPSRKLISLD